MLFFSTSLETLKTLVPFCTALYVTNQNWLFGCLPHLESNYSNHFAFQYPNLATNWLHCFSFFSTRKDFGCTWATWMILMCLCKDTVLSAGKSKLQQNNYINGITWCRESAIMNKKETADSKWFAELLLSWRQIINKWASLSWIHTWEMNCWLTWIRISFIAKPSDRKI